MPRKAIQGMMPPPNVSALTCVNQTNKAAYKAVEACPIGTLRVFRHMDIDLRSEPLGLNNFQRILKAPFLGSWSGSSLARLGSTVSGVSNVCEFKALINSQRNCRLPPAAIPDK